MVYKNQYAYDILVYGIVGYVYVCTIIIIIRMLCMVSTSYHHRALSEIIIIYNLKDFNLLAHYYYRFYCVSGVA